MEEIMEKLIERKKRAEEELKNKKGNAMLVYRGAMASFDDKTPEENVNVMRLVVDAWSWIGYCENGIKEIDGEIAKAEAGNNGEAV